MQNYLVCIDICGRTIPAGLLREDEAYHVVFQYLPAYLNRPEAAAVSVGLPLQEEAFSVRATQAFFEGLLPEGFTRRSVAQAIRADEGDYLALLYGLGRECMGAVRIVSMEGLSEEEVNAFDVLPDELKTRIYGDEQAHYELLTPDQVRALAAEGATKSAELVTKAHLSLAGASGKVGLYYDAAGRQWYLPKGDAPSTHIVKQSHVRLEQIVLNEQICLRTAARCGINVPHSFIINVGDGRDEEVLLATERYDRIFLPESAASDGLPVPVRLHQEDFCQALGRVSQEKYEKGEEGYLKRVFDLLRSRSAEPVEDLLQLWDLLVFDVLVGNTDAHIKNMSLLYAPDLKSVKLAPAYDILSTTIYESSTHELAFRFGNVTVIDDITRESFAEAAKNAGLGQKMMMDRFEAMMARFPETLSQTAEELQDIGFSGAHALAERILESGGWNVLMNH